ncbi:YybH family protein [Shewanella gelidii]|uniref:Periplasmic L-asparaginase n=1 Tax=Shewanella gelidii TaxID=1642821 RepID=A0A917JYJ6_9GAMM|nr:nuclear transport factor 2 family protein [Shewanella gelidii]MCL1098932.1 nuclear transport factor 2 family protein [Shewanella gelidii]GGI90061.1 periplasmic L-asparaginase [Shewanella gelidii]
MRQFIWALVLLSPLSLAASPQEEITQVITAQQQAWNQGDLDSYMKGYWQSEHMRFVTQNDFRYGWEPTLAAYKKHYPNKAALGELKFTIHHIQLLSDVAAIVVGRWELTRQKDNPKGVFTLLMEKIEEQWLITHDHTSE